MNGKIESPQILNLSYGIVACAKRLSWNVMEDLPPSSALVNGKIFILAESTMVMPVALMWPSHVRTRGINNTLSPSASTRLQLKNVLHQSLAFVRGSHQIDGSFLCHQATGSPHPRPGARRGLQPSIVESVDATCRL